MTRLRAPSVVPSTVFVSIALWCGAARAETIVIPAGTTTQTTVPSSDGHVQVIIVQEGSGSGAPRKKRSRLPAVEGEEPPPGYYEHTTHIRGLWVAGLAIFGVGYAVTTLAGAIADVNESYDSGHFTWLGLIPGAGPFIIAADREISGPADPMFVLLGVMQVGGIAMTIGGLAATDTVWLSKEASLAPTLRLGAGCASLSLAF